MEDGWIMRRAAAAARTMLTAAAATRWKVSPDECKTEQGAVVHAASNRRLQFGELVGEAAKLPVPKEAPLKTPADCLGYPLLHDLNRQDWPLWFEAHGVVAPHCKKGPAFSENHLIVRAAVAGQGLALVRDIYAEDDLRSKKLIKALTVNWPVQFA